MKYNNITLKEVKKEPIPICLCLIIILIKINKNMLFQISNCWDYLHFHEIQISKIYLPKLDIYVKRFRVNDSSLCFAI